VDFMNWIVQKLNDASEFFYSIYLETYSWVYPFDRVAPLFYEICLIFNRLAWSFYDFSQWVSDTADKVSKILDWNTIWSYILSYVPNLEAIRDWFSQRWDWLQAEINNWWSETTATVLGWIDAAKDWAALQISALQKQVNSLWAEISEVAGRIPDVTELTLWFSNWWGNIRVNLEGWWSEKLLDVQRLTDDAFRARDGLWAGWQELRDRVTEFFTDPEEWLYKAIDRIIERFW